MVVANPTVSTNNGWPVGFWAAELTHPYLELTERGVEVTIASPDGGQVEFDNLSDPRDPSKWSAEDLISTRTFYEAKKITGAFCHGVSALVNVRLSNGE